MADQKFFSKKKHSEKKWILIIGIILVLVIFILWPLWGMDNKMYEGLNALFAGLAFIGLVYTIFKQQDDFNEQISEMRKDRVDSMVLNYTGLIRDSVKNLYVLYDMIGANKKELKGIDVLKDYEKHFLTIKSWFKGDIKRMPTDEEIRNEVALVPHYSVIMVPVASTCYSALNKIICIIDDCQCDEYYRNLLKKDLWMIISPIPSTFLHFLYISLLMNYPKREVEKSLQYFPANIYKNDFVENYFNICLCKSEDDMFNYVKSNINIHP